MKRILPLLSFLIVYQASAAILFQDGFENGTGQWSGDGSPEQSAERAASGGNSMHIPRRGSVFSREIPVKPETRYRISIKSYSTARSGFTLLADIFDAGGKLLTIPRAYSTGEGLWDADRQKQKRNYWMPMSLGFDTSKEAVSVRIRIQKHNSNTQIWIDDVVLEELDAHPQLRVDAQSTAESLMLPGPDGYLYPNFTRAGLTASWKLPERVFKVESFGAVADDGKDDSDAIDRAIEAAAGAGGGVVEFGPGTYRLSRKVSVRSDHIVLRGTDREKSRLELGLPDNGVGVFTTGSDNFVSPRATVRIFFPKKGAKQLRVRAGNLESESFPADRFEELPDAPDFGMVIFSMEPYFEALGGKDKIFITAEVEYDGGRIEKSSVPFILDRNHRPGVYSSSYFTFSGRALPLEPVAITSDLKRGDDSFRVADSSGIKPGDIVELRLPITERWAPVNNNVPWWKFISFRSEVAAVKGKQITLVQPVRIDFPLQEKPELLKTDPIRNSGIENLTLSQVGEIQIELKMRTISFADGFNCRASRLTVDRPGTSAVYGVRMKNFEMADCKFTQPWRTKFGGLAYIGWDHSYDCLIADVESYAMRHAPLFNWSCSGNVVTGSFFNESDAQWHTGFCHDNLIDDSRIVTTTNKFNSYGWAFYAVPAEDAEHGGIGPRNVVYNCEATAFRGGIYLGGYNREFMFMYNKIDTIQGPGILERLGGGENKIVGNSFLLKESKVPAIYLESLDSTGDIIKNNTLYGGNGQMLAGAGKPKEESGNRVLPWREPAGVPRPRAPVPSIYRYQLERFKR